VLEIEEEIDPENTSVKIYTKYLNSEEMILLIKDKYLNWKDLLEDELNKKLQENEFVDIPN